MGSSLSRHEEAAASRTGRPVKVAAELPKEFIEKLNEKGLAGEKLQLPGTEAYLLNNVCWNHDAIGSPSAIWVPKSVDDLKAFMLIYSANPLGAPHSLSISGGRHSHYGLKNDAFVIDMSSFQKLEIDEQNMIGRFGAGLKLRQVDAACFAKNVATTFGTNPDTGVAGLTMGGGFGWLARRHGLSIDNLIRARVVLANGEDVVADRDGEYKDLFWAIRGGGGNFGIVTEFEFKLYKRGPVVKGASVFLTRKFTNVPAVLAEWKEFAIKAPDTVQCSLAMPCGGPVVLPYAYIGDDLAEADALLAPLKAIGNPLIKECGVADYSHPSLKSKDLQSSAMPHQMPGNYYEAGVTLTDLTEDVIKVLLKYTSSDSGLVPNKVCQIVIFALGGAISRADPDECPVGFRGAGFVALILGGWPNQKSNEAYMRERGRVQKWVRGTVRELCLYGVKSFYNVIGADAGAGPQPTEEEKKAAADAIIHSSCEDHPDDVERKSEEKSPDEGSVAPSSPEVGVAPMHIAHVADEKVSGIKSVYNFSNAVFQRLEAAKRKYDPQNLFRNNNNIVVRQ